MLFLVGYWIFSFTYWKISLKMPILDAIIPVRKPKMKLANFVSLVQICMSIQTPALVMFLYFRIGVDNPVMSLRGSEIAIAVLMQVIYGINLVTLFFIIDALVRIYDGLVHKSQFFFNAMDMIIHALASFVFIGTLVMQDLIDISKARLSAVVTP